MDQKRLNKIVLWSLMIAGVIGFQIYNAHKYETPSPTAGNYRPTPQQPGLQPQQVSGQSPARVPLYRNVRELRQINTDIFVDEYGNGYHANGRLWSLEECNAVIRQQQGWQSANGGANLGAYISRNNDEVMEGILSSGRLRDQVGDTTSRWQHESMMGTGQVYDPYTGNIYNVPNNGKTYAIGPDGNIWEGENPGVFNSNYRILNYQ